MFTGIVETTGLIEEIVQSGTNRSFRIASAISSELRVDQSLSHDGVCLTVEEVSAGSHVVTAIQETLDKTNLSARKPGDTINLERCMAMNGRLDGHIVQGHVDATAACLERKNKDGSVEFVFEFDRSFAELIVEKGSVTVNGISLTCFDITENTFTIAVIPYTLAHTNISDVYPGTLVNIEFDILGKYVNRKLNLQK